MKNQKTKKRILTGDRPTGLLHLGHYVGSLENRVGLQDDYNCFFIVADYQVLTDHLRETKKVSRFIRDIVLDYLSVGIDPEKSTIFIQSQIPEIAELTMFFSMMVSLSRVRQNPTVKEEIRNSRISKLSYGFVGYPISQAADILIVRANVVPVGEDQLPHLEQTREIAQFFNRLFARTFPVPQPLIGRVARLPGLNGQKMSKSLDNCIYLSDSAGVVDRKIKRAITDPARIHTSDRGCPEVCTVFQYHKAFNPLECKEIEERCRQGKIGCVACKNRMIKVINEFLEPIREKRKSFESQKDIVGEILDLGRKKTKKEAEKTMAMVKRAMSFDYSSMFSSRHF